MEGSSIRAVLTRPVLIAIQSYGWLALLDISFWAILTVFLPVPISAGGLNIPPPTVGLIFGAMGVVNGFIQVVVFPPAFKKFGPKRIMTTSMMCYWVIFSSVPLMHGIAMAHPAEPGALNSRVWGLLAVLVVFTGVMTMGYSAFELLFQSICLRSFKC